MRFRSLHFLLTALLSILQQATKAQSCFFSEDFTNGMPTGWDLGPAVERRTPEGEGLGEFVPAWAVGNAAEANADGYFPVTDSPVGNRFVMANDAAAPCNCDLADVSLTTPVIDLTDRSGVALECRVFNENTFGAGPTVLEASTTDGEWTTIYTVPSIEGRWQRLFIDLSGYDGSTGFRLRLRWSDGGSWAGGFAVDDICLRERGTYDLVVTNAQLGETGASVFTTGDQRLYYRQLPLSQTAPVTIAATVKNNGTAALHQIRLSATIGLNGTDHGPFISEPIGELTPGAFQEVAIATGWLPDATGHATITITGSADEPDDVPGADEVATGSVEFTGEGPDAGYSIMSCDHGLATSSIGGSGGFIAFNRMEMAHGGDRAKGISVVYADHTQMGAVIRAILMDANYTTLDTSTRRTLQQADIDAIRNGSPLYETLSQAVELIPGDYHVGLQQLTAGGDHPVHVAVSGEATVGRSGIMEGLGFTIRTLHTTPMVRLHLAEGPVGVQEAHISDGQPLVFPNPADQALRAVFPHASSLVEWQLSDASGRALRKGASSDARNSGELVINVVDLPNGAYFLTLRSGTSSGTTRVIVMH